MKFKVKISKYYYLSEKEKTALERLFGLKFRKGEGGYHQDFKAGDVYIEINSLEDLVNLAKKVSKNKLTLERVDEENIFVISRDPKTGEWILEIYNEWRE